MTLGIFGMNTISKTHLAYLCEWMIYFILLNIVPPCFVILFHLNWVFSVYFRSRSSHLLSDILFNGIYSTFKSPPIERLPSMTVAKKNPKESTIHDHNTNSIEGEMKTVKNVTHLSITWRDKTTRHWCQSHLNCHSFFMEYINTQNAFIQPMQRIVFSALNRNQCCLNSGMASPLCSFAWAVYRRKYLKEFFAENWSSTIW